MNIAAFFDVDGTLVPPPSLEKRFLRYLRWRGEISCWDFARCLAPIAWKSVWAMLSGEWEGMECIAAQCKAYLAGVPTNTMDTWLAWMERHPLEKIPAAVRRLARHAAQGHQIFLVSGTLRPLAEAVARTLPVLARVCATELESANGRWTGTVGEAICGPAKARALKRLAAEFSLDLARSFAYGDSYADRWMLGRVGYPRVVRAQSQSSQRLAWLAHERGWPVLRWGSDERKEVKDDAKEQRSQKNAKKREFHAA